MPLNVLEVLCMGAFVTAGGFAVAYLLLRYVDIPFEW